MTPEVNAHFTLNLSNACNWCSACCMPKGLYVSKHEVVEAWDNTKGTVEDAVASYVRMRQIARRRFSEFGLDGNSGLEALDREIDLTALSKDGMPPSADDLARTAAAVESFLRGNGVDTSTGLVKWIRGWFK